MTMEEKEYEDDENGPLGIDPVVREAVKRWDRCTEWESIARARFIDDIKFENGDSDNGNQWPNAIKRAREVDSRPCLTMNIIRQHNLQISNAARKAKSSVSFVPQGNGATVESAKVMQQLVRRIENISSAQNAYTKARNFQIGGGIGWWRVVTEYSSHDSFDQEIYIRPVNDPLSVYMDPDCRQEDCSDAIFAFVFDNIPKEQFEEDYPEFADMVGKSPLPGASGDNDWITKDHIRVCEYFRKVNKADKLISFVSNGVRRTILKSKLAKNMLTILDDPLTKVRDTSIEVIEWHLIAGDQVIDQTEWVGKYIPLVRVLGEEVIIDGIMDRKGHTRWQKDAQRMFNYNASSQVEFVALQAKTPWVAASQSIEEYESYWNSANSANHSVLPYNAFDEQGNPLPPPMRTVPPTNSPAYDAGMETAFNQIMMVSGQWQNQMGMMGNERTGAAIKQRQRQSETSVFHFQDNYENSLIYTGKILLDLIPKIYDTQRVLMVLADNDAPMEVMIDPQAAQAFALTQQENDTAAASVFNPTIGDYSVAPTAGPAYNSSREATTEALMLILTQAPSLTPIIGDLLLSSMDFDKAQEAAQRLRRMVPSQATGQGSSQEEMALQQQVAQLQSTLAKALQKNAKSELKLVGKEQMRNIDVYEAETKRMAALSDFLPYDEEGLRSMIRQIVDEAEISKLSPIISANADDIDIDAKDSMAGVPAETEGEEAPMKGARKAPDGNWYIEDPSRPGKYLAVER